MKQDTEDIYRRLHKHLDQFPIGYPSTASGVEIRLLKYFIKRIKKIRPNRRPMLYVSLCPLRVIHH